MRNLILIYFIPGVMAPVIFRFAPNPQVGGRIAGFLFCTATALALWGLRIVGAHRWAQYAFAVLLTANLTFWSWRFLEHRPLREVLVFGYSGAALHGLMTTLYVVGLVVLLAATFQIARFSKSKG
jgi:hypothetical protein